jgi:NAD-dependent dihydropyrimidine dehydrogenase PreA subunit
MSSTRRYIYYANKAAQCFQRGEHRESADDYWESFISRPGDWEESVYHILHGYTSILREKYFSPSRKDLKNLKSLAYDEKAPNLYRQEAVWTLGLLAWDARKREKAADCYREALAFIDQASDLERNKKMMHTLVRNAGTTTMPSTGLLAVSQILQESRNYIAANLSQMEDPFGNPPGLDNLTFVRSDGTTMPNIHITTQVPVNELSSVAPRLAIGGSTCDSCGKTWQDVGKPKMDYCIRCKNAYYCSRTCQKTAWKNGHRETCRKAGQIEIGDIMKLRKIVAKPELNGVLVRILSKDSAQEGRWQVESFKVASTKMSIATEKLEHIRPAK